MLEMEDGRVELRAVTGLDYGRVYDHELMDAVRRIAGDGTGDTRWKVPGELDWSTGIYNPRVDMTKETTTLYASGRDVFMFLVDDLNPIEAGRLPDGSARSASRSCAGAIAWFASAEVVCRRTSRRRGGRRGRSRPPGMACLHSGRGGVCSRPAPGSRRAASAAQPGWDSMRSPCFQRSKAPLATNAMIAAMPAATGAVVPASTPPTSGSTETIP